MNRLYRNIVKRILDTVFALILLAALLPIIIIFAVICYLYTGGTPLFIQERGVTLNRSFRIYKLRTLRYGAPAWKPNDIFRKAHLEAEVIPMGRFLRRTGLDELPQLINVIKGEMSIIGPRPLSKPDLETLRDEYPEYYKEREKIKSKPGISGQWQIFGDREEGAENLIKHDSQYERDISFTTDLFIMLSTIPVILLARHSDAILQNNDKNPLYSDKLIKKSLLF